MYQQYTLCLPASNLVAADVKPAMPEYTSVRHLAENVTLASLDNGLTVIVQENHTAPVATVRCYVKNTGSAFEGRYLGAGLSHVLEHVVAGGTTVHRSEKEIEKIIASLRRRDQCLHHQRPHDVLHRLPGPQRHDRHRTDGRCHAAHHLRAQGVRPRVESRSPRTGRRRGRSGARHERPAGPDGLRGPSGPASGDRLPPGAQRHHEPGDHRLLSRALRAEQPDLRRRRRREHGGGAGPRGAAMGHAPRAGDVHRPARGAGAGFAAGGGPRDGRHGLRLRHRLADRHALAARHVRPGPGGLYPRRGRKLAAGAAVEVRKSAGPQRRRRQQYAALRPRLLRRHRQQQAGDLAEGVGGNRPPGLPAPRRGDRRGRTGQGQETEGGRTGLPAADGPAAGREPGAEAIWPRAIRSSIAPIPRRSRRSPRRRSARWRENTSCRRA